MAAAKTAAKAAGAVAAGGGPEDPVGDVAAAGIVAKDSVASKSSQQGVKDTAKKASESAPPAGGAKPDSKPGRKPDTTSGGGKGKSRAKRAVGFAFSGNRRVLTAEFVACMVVVILGTLMSPADSKDTPMRALVKASALSGLFLLLALVAAGGTGPAKAATALGTLITAAYVLTSTDVHNVVKWTADFFKKPAAAPATEEGQ